MSFDAVRVAAEKHVGDTNVPGLVALVAHGEDVHVEAIGRLGVGRPPVQRDSLFRIASTTKPITAAVTMALVDEGLIGLDEPVDRLLPELADRRVLRRPDGPLDDTVPAERPITTRDLLSYTGAFGWNGGFGTSWLADPGRDLTVIVMTQRLFESSELPPVHRDIHGAAHAGRP